MFRDKHARALIERQADTIRLLARRAGINLSAYDPGGMYDLEQRITFLEKNLAKLAEAAGFVYDPGKYTKPRYVKAKRGK